MNVILILDVDTRGIGSRRWMTILADQVLAGVTERHKGMQIVVGFDYDVWDFTEALKAGTIELKSHNIGLLVGNNHIKRDMKINVGKQIYKLLQRLAMVKPRASVFVCSVMVRPDDEELLTPVVIRANQTIHAMCQKMSRSGSLDVKYVPLHQEYLEKWKHFDIKAGKMRMTTRISKPHDKYFVGKGCQLNHEGIDRAFQTLKRSVSGELGPPMKVVMDVPSLKVCISGESVTETDTEAVSVNSDNAEEKMGNTGVSDRPSGTVGVIGGQQKSEKRKSQSPSLEGQKGKVSKMVSKFERRQLALDHLDLELGGESVVAVDLGDRLDESSQ